MRKYAHLGPGRFKPFDETRFRGPQGQDVLYNPTLVKDLPLREVQGKVSDGLNLDGTLGGEATAKTCKHEKFSSPEGEPGVDNQLFRALGCSQGFVKGGILVSLYATQFREVAQNRVLVEITDVDDERNDDHVEVALYKGIDGIVYAAGKAVPWLPQRIDVRYPRYTSRTSGRIVDGVLYTEPVDSRIAVHQLVASGERFIRDARLKLRLTDTGAEGLLAGYENLREWWRLVQTGAALDLVLAGGWSPPALHEAIFRLADGYRNPETGQCAAISAAYRIEAVRALIVRPGDDDPLVAGAKLQRPDAR